MARGLAALAITAALAFPSWAGATTYTVNRTDDPYPAPSCTPTDCTLRAAVAAVNAGSGGDVIVLPPAEYTLTGAAAIPVTKQVTIDGPGARRATLSTTNFAGGRHFMVSALATIEGLTLVDEPGGITAGGIVVNGPGRLHLVSVTMRGNGVGQGGNGAVYGGAVQNNNATATVSDSAFVGNFAFPGIAGSGHGGAIATIGAAGTTITNVTFVGNSAGSGGQGAGKGGALYTGPGATTTVTNSTLTGNKVTAGSPGYLPTGGNIASEGVTNLRNTIVAEGAAFQFGGAPAVGVGNCGSGVSSLGNNLDSTEECGFTAAGDLRNTDPLLGHLQDNGGPTDTRAIASSSPAFDSGTASGCPAADQRGTLRPQGAACDIGAFELAVTAAPPPAPGAPVPDIFAPTLTALSVRPSVFRLGRALPRLAQRAPVGTTIRFTLSEAAAVRLAFTTRRPGRRVRGRCVRPRRANLNRPRCRREVIAGRLSVAAPAGATSLRFAGRLTARKRLRPGRYRLRATATDAAGNRSPVATAGFRLLPAR